MTNIIPFKTVLDNPKCSFCGTTKEKSKHFFESGDGKFICGACVVIAKHKIEGSNND